jgi:tetratricopeptide (TPR) repeat protein
VPSLDTVDRPKSSSAGQLKDRITGIALALLAGCLAGSSVCPQLLYPTVALSILVLPLVSNVCLLALATELKSGSRLKLFLFRYCAAINQFFIFVPGGYFAFWTAVNLTSLAVELQQRNRLAEAEKSLRQALVILRKYNQSEDWLLSVLLWLSRVLQEQGRLAECEALLRDSLAQDCAAGGLPDGVKGDSLHDNLVIQLAVVLGVQKKYAEQECLAQEKLSSLSGSLRGVLVLSYTAALRSQNKSAEIETVLRREFKACSIAGEGDDVLKCRVLTLLIPELCLNKKYEEANQLLGPTLELAGVAKPDYIDLQLLGKAVTPTLNGGRVKYDQEAEELAAKFLKLVEGSPADAANQVTQLQTLIVALKAMAYVLYRRRKFEEAMTFNQRIFALEQNLAKNKPTLGLMVAYFISGRTLRRMGRLAEAGEHLTAALAIAPVVERSEAYGSTLCNIYLVLAEVRLDRGRPGDAETLVNTAAPELEKLPADSRLPSLFLKVRGMISYQKGNLVQAEECIKQCIEECQNRPVVNEMNMSDLYLQYSAILARQGRVAEGKEWEQKAQPEQKLLVVSE